MNRIRTCLLAAGCALALAGCAQPGHHAGMHGGMQGGMQGGMGMRDGMGMKGMMESMHRDMMGMPMSGDADVDFALMMRRHHQGAIDMAQHELRNGKDAKMREMAQKMIADQTREIQELDRFLASRGRTPPR